MSKEPIIKIVRKQGVRHIDRIFLVEPYRTEKTKGGFVCIIKNRDFGPDFSGRVVERDVLLAGLEVRV